MDDDLLVEMTLRLQAVGEAGANQENAEQNEAGKTQEAEQQHWKCADKKDRQQRHPQQRLGLSWSHRTISRK